MTERMQHHPHRLLRRALAVLALCAGAASAAPLDDMRRLVDSGQFGPAYALGQHNPDLIGDVHFDFLFGVAAVSSGHVAEGLLALERHLGAVPANDRARLELARGYFLIGEYARARSEFEFVLRYKPSAATRRTIEEILTAIQLRDGSSRRGGDARFYAEAGIGRDTNVNGGTFVDQLRLGFDTVDIAGTPTQAVADNVLQVAVGGLQTMRVSNQLSVFAGADLDQRENFRAKEFNITNVAANAGFSQLRGAALYKLTLSAGELLVGGSRYRDTLAVAGELNLPLGAQRNLAGFARYSEFRHAAAEAERDARESMLAAMFTQSFPDLAGAPQLGVRASWTMETNNRARSDLSRDVPLLRLSGSFAPAERTRLAAGLTAYTARYHGTDQIFGTQRFDKSLNLDLVLSYAVDPQWTLRAEWMSYLTRSNQDLYDSDRHSLTFKTRYQY